MLSTPTISISNYSDNTTSSSFPIITLKEFKILNKTLLSLPLNLITWSGLESKFNELYGENGSKLEELEDGKFYYLFLKLSKEEGKNWLIKWSNLIYSNYYLQEFNNEEEEGEQETEKEIDYEEEEKIKLKQFNQFQSRLAQLASGHNSPKIQISSLPSTSTPTPVPVLLQHRTATNASLTSAMQTPKPPHRNFFIETPIAKYNEDDYTSSQHHHNYYASSEDYYVGIPRAPPIPSISYNKHSKIQSTSMLPTNTYDPTPSTSSHIPHFTTSTPVPQYKQDLIPTISPSLQQKLTNQSNLLRNSFLSSQYYSLWRTKFLFYELRNAQTTQGANKFLLRTSLQIWSRRTKEKRLMEEWEVGRRERESMRCLKMWGKRLKERRVRRYKKELQEVRDEVEDRVEKELLEGVLEKWRSKTQDSLATSFYNSHLKASILSHWFERCRFIEFLESKADLFNKELYIRIWFDRAKIHFDLRIFREEREKRERKKLLDYWRGRTQDRQLLKRLDLAADQFRQASLLSVWKDRFLSVQALETPCAEFIAFRNTELLTSSFQTWSLQSLATQFRSYSLSRTTPTLMKKCLLKWRKQFRFNNIELEGRSIALESHLTKIRLYKLFLIWKREFQYYSNYLPSLTDSFLQHSNQDLVRRLLVNWKNKLEVRKFNEVKADEAREFFLLRNAFGRFRVLTGKVRAERLEREWELEILRGIWIDWKRVTKKRIMTNNIGGVVAEGVQLSIIRRTFNDWYQRVADIRDREIIGPLELIKKSGERLKRESFNKMRLVLQRRHIQVDLAESCRLGYEDDRKRFIFLNWLEATRHSRELKRRLEEFELNNERNLLQLRFDHWRELSLRQREEVVMTDRDDRIVRNAWESWKGRSKLLPLMERQKARTINSMFLYWIEQVPDPLLVKQAEKLDLLIVTRGCFDVWRIRYQAKSAIRSVNRFRNYASTSHNSSNSNPTAPTTPSFIKTTPTRQLSVSPNPFSINIHDRSPSPAFSNNSYGSGHYFSPPPLPSPFADTASTPSPPPPFRSRLSEDLPPPSFSTQGYFEPRRSGTSVASDSERDQGSVGRRGLRARLSNLNLGNL